jgi:serine/threonine-protein kinase
LSFLWGNIEVKAAIFLWAVGSFLKNFRVITLSLLHPVKHTPVQVWSFPSEPIIRIGRSSDNQVVLYSAVVSRYHLELRQSNSMWEVVNTGTNGTYVDGKRVTQMAIADGAVLRLARSGPNIQVHLGVAQSEFSPPATTVEPKSDETSLTSCEISD